MRGLYGPDSLGRKKKKKRNKKEKGENQVVDIKRISGTNAKMIDRNREYFLLFAPCSKSQGADGEGGNISYVPALCQTFCSRLSLYLL